ncbi:hypothetical protein CUMW_003880 [Citrus unshiu]|nr:hypothetical protein CUMW_003880 [Citrus unshiu]
MKMEEEKVKAAEEEETWSKETVPKVIDLREMNNAGNRLVAALSIPRYRHVREINLEFAQDIEDRHLELLKTKCLGSLQDLESLNLNGCQKISDKGIEIISSTCPELKVFSIYWNNILDKSLQLIADNYQELESLNLTRCVKVTDGGLQKILIKCSSLRSLNLYALSGFTDEAYKKISLLAHLKFLDLCGAQVISSDSLSKQFSKKIFLLNVNSYKHFDCQNLSDEGLACIAKCKNLVSLNLTWCVHITDVGVMAIAEGCSSLEFLSLFGIVGVTDKCLEVLSRFCSNTLTTLDVNGCVGIKQRSRDELLQLFPHLMCFKVHS